MKVEKHTRFYEMNPVGRFTHKEIDYCIGSGGPYFDMKKEFPRGYYQTAYYILNQDRLVICGDQQYEIDHNKYALIHKREDMRIEACHELAREFIELGIKNGALPALMEMVSNARHTSH